MNSPTRQHTAKEQRPALAALASRLTGVIGLALPLLLPATVDAVGIGDITLQSRLGEPLSASVPLTASAEESLNESCLSLITPASPEMGNPDDFLVRAKLSLLQEKGNAVIQIRGEHPVNTAYIRLLLQVRCPGQGSVSRTFTLLPGLETRLNQAQPIELASTPAGTQPATEKPAPKTSGTAKAKPPRPVTAHPADTITTIQRQKTGEKFQLRLSTAMTDAGNLSKLSEGDRAQLLAQQRMLDQDDQTASFLALQHQVKQLQDELNAMRKQIGLPSSASAVVAPPVAQSQPQPARVSAPQAAPSPTAETGPDLAWTDYLTIGLIILLLALLGLYLYQKRLKSRWTGEDISEQLDEESYVAPELFPSNLGKPQTPPISVPKPEVSTPKLTTPEPSPSVPLEIYVPESIAAPPEMTGDAETAQEADWVIEEAELYAVHGHPELAIQILEKLLDQTSDKPQAWLLLLSILSSLDRRDDFERTARRFATLASSRSHWREVQALGQRIDKDNPLYFGDPGIAVEAVAPLPKLNRRPLGAILLDNDALSEEVLMGVLAQFNPKRDGRIGGYLMQHGLISNEQLETALRIQRAEIEADTKR